MSPNDRESKTRFLMLLGVPVLLFGGFALAGVWERTRLNNAPDWVESPAKVSAERAETIAKGREAFTLRKQMSVLGKKEEWLLAASLISDDLLSRNDLRNLRFLRGEAWFRAGDKRGVVGLQDALKNDDSLNPHEADLIGGKAAAFRAATTRALRDADLSRITPLDANNLAWRASLAPGLTDADGIQKAAVSSEYAVEAARKERDIEALATYTNTLGAVYVRAGRGKEAVQTLAESERLRPDPFNAALLALAYHGLGDTEAATAERVKVTRYLNNTYATRDGQAYRHQLLLFWREAQTEQELSTAKAK